MSCVLILPSNEEEAQQGSNRKANILNQGDNGKTSTLWKRNTNTSENTNTNSQAGWDKFTFEGSPYED